MDSMEYLIIGLLILLVLCNIFLAVMLIRRSGETDEAELAKSISESSISAIKQLGGLLSENQRLMNEMQGSQFTRMNGELATMQRTLDEHMKEFYSSFGQLHGMAESMTDLKQLLSNVKTRGIIGEVQLEAILDEILAPEQFDKNVVTIPGSQNRVEFAVKLPHDEEGFIYLPIDAKFPLDAYRALQDANQSGAAAEIAAQKKLFINRIKQFARDIRTKYVEPPYTTDFAIMFLPAEGLYLEVINCGLVETLQRDYKINIAGPSTMAATLNALQMGFKTLALEKRASEVWEILGSVKSEFAKFSDGINSAKKHMEQAEKDLENLVGVRTRAIEKRLDKVERL